MLKINLGDDVPKRDVPGNKDIPNFHHHFRTAAKIILLIGRKLILFFKERVELLDGEWLLAQLLFSPIDVDRGGGT